MPIKFELPTIIEIINVETVAASALNTTDLSIDGYLALDGYTIDLSAGVSLNQFLQYNGTSFVAADIGGGSGDLLGTLNANKVPYATAIHTIADSNMSWDNTNKTLTIDTNSNSAGLKVSDGGRTFEIKPDLTNNLITLGVSTNHDLGFYTNSMPIQMTLTTDGYLGIGRSPLYLLDAYGDIRTSQRIIIDNSSASVSPSNMGAFRYNVSTQHLEFSENGSAWQQLGTGGGGNLSGTLTTGLIPYASASGTLSNTNLTWDVADDYLGVRQPAPTATLDVLEANATSGNPLAFKITGGSHTTLPASTEVNDINFVLNRTVQLNTGALGTQRAVVLSAPTYSFVGASTITTAATLAVTNAPQAGTNATITKPYSIWAQAGVAAFDGHIKVDGYTVDLSAGATTNQVLQYNGTSFVAATVSGTMAIGGSITSATSGSVLYVNSSTQLAQDNSNFFWDATNHRLGLGTGAPVATAEVKPTVVTTGTPIGIQYTGAAHTTLSNAEVNDGYFKLDRTVQFGQNTTLGTQRAIYISAPTYSSSVATKTITTAATFAISGPPIAGTNTTLTGTYPMWVQSGIARFDGQILAGPAAASTINNATVAAKFVNNVSGAGTVYLQNLHTSGVSQLELYDNNNSFHSAYGYANAGGGAYIYNQSGDAFSIQQNGNHALHIDSSSRVGINLSSALSNNFGVNGNAAIGNSYTNTSAPSNGLIVQGQTGFGTTSFTNASVNVEIRNANGGSVGGQLYIRNTNSAGQAEIDYADSAGTFRMSIGYDNTSSGTWPNSTFIYTGTSTPFTMYTNNAANATAYRSDGNWMFNAATNTGQINTAAGQHLATFFKDYTYPGDTTASQIAVAGKTDATKIMAIGMDTNSSNGFGYIQASKQGTSATILALQPAGGSVGIGMTAPSNRYSLAITGNSTQLESIALYTTTVTGYADMVWFNSSNSQVGGIGWANASTGTTLASHNFFYTPALDWLMSDGTTDYFRWYTASNAVGYEMSNGVSATNSASSKGKIRYNATAQHFQISENTGSYINFMNIGSPVSNSTSGSVPYIDSSNNLAQDNANLFWDATNHSLGIGMNSPGTEKLYVQSSVSAASTAAIKNTSASGYSTMVFINSSGTETGAVGVANASAAAANVAGKMYMGSPGDIVFTTYAPATLMYIKNSNGYVGIGNTSSPAALLELIQPVATTGSPIAYQLSGAAHTTLTASTEAIDGYYKLDRTVQFSTGALTTQRAMYISAPTYAFSGASTLTTAATLAIGNAPQAGTNATITNAYALWVQAGKTKFDGDVAVQTFLAAGVGSNLTSGTTITPTNLIHHVTGTNNISTITAPISYTISGNGGVLYVIPDGAFTWDTGGNIAVGGTAVTNRMITFIYDNGTSKWYPSYV